MGDERSKGAAVPCPGCTIDAKIDVSRRQAYLNGLIQGLSLLDEDAARAFHGLMCETCCAVLGQIAAFFEEGARVAMAAAERAANGERPS